MNDVYETESDEAVLRKLLPDDLKPMIKWMVGGGRYGAQTLASSVIGKRQRPTALIINTETHNRHAILERVEFAHDMMRRVAGEVPFVVIEAVPEMEAVFLQNRPFLERIIGRSFTDLEWEMGQYNPRIFLRSIAGESALMRLLDSLTPHDIETLRTHSLVQGLIGFLHSVVQESA